MSSFSIAASSSSPSIESLSAEWYALYTRSRHEKQVAAQLVQREIDSFLPLYPSLRRWKDRRVQRELPLFPSYVFVHIPLRDRVRALEVPGAVRFVAFHGLPSALAKEDVERLRYGLSLGIRAEPHPYLTVGRRVRVTGGPLIGMQGILMRRKDRFRLLLSIDLIMRSIAVEVDACDVEPLS